MTPPIEDKNPHNAPAKKKITYETLIAGEDERLLAAFDHLVTSIQIQVPGGLGKKLMVTSTRPREGHGFVSRQLACHFAKQNEDVLLIQLQAPGGHDTISAKMGLEYLLKQLTSHTLTCGQVKDYGLFDLLLLIYLQNKSGQLTLTDKDGARYELAFKNGIWCAAKTPWEQIKYVPDTKTNTLPSFINKLKMAYRDMVKKDLADFSFIAGENLQFHQTASDVDRFLPDEEPLADLNFVARLLKKNIIQISRSCSLMLCGSRSLKWADAKTFAGIKRLLAVFRHQFDRIILQAPAVFSGKETRLIAPIMDGTILVVRQNYTRRRLIKQAVHQLIDHDAHVIGTVLNQNRQYF